MTPDPWCTATTHGGRRDYLLKSNRCRCTAARAAMATYARERWRDLREGGARTIDATGTRRRIEALMRAGWPDSAIGARLYVGGGTVRGWRTRRTITPRNARLVVDLYDQIGLDDGPSQLTAANALRRGWPSPIEWGDNMDDPTAKPLNIDRPLGAGPRAAVPLDDLEMLIRTGGTWETVAARTGTTVKAIDRRLRRAARLDLCAALNRQSESYSVTPWRNQWSA